MFKPDSNQTELLFKIVAVIEIKPKDLIKNIK